MPRVVVLRSAADRKLWLRRGDGLMDWEWTETLDDATKFGTRQEALEAVGRCTRCPSRQPRGPMLPSR